MTLMAFEGIATATAMPVVARELGIAGDYTWAFTAYVVASLFSMVAGGVWSDTTGPRGPLLAGVGAALVGAVVSGAANGLPLLVVGRSLQGLGGGAIIVALYVLIARAYDVHLRPKAFSVLAAAWVVPSLVGPLVSGFLADHVTWRAVFWLVPFIVIPATAVLVPRIATYQGGQPQPNARRRLLAGLVATAALFAVQDGALRTSALGVAELIVGLAVLVRSVRYLLPAGALRMKRGLPTSTMMRGFLAASYFSAEVFVPLALVQIRGLSTTAAGATLAASALLWSAGSYVQGRLPGHRDRSAAVRLGAAIVVVGVATLPLALVSVLPPWIAAVSWAVGAFGMGLAIPSVSVQVMRLSPPQDQGVNSAAIQIVDSVGVVVATSAVGFVYAAAIRSGGADQLTFTLLWLASATIAAAAAVLAGRMRVPPTVGAHG